MLELNHSCAAAPELRVTATIFRPDAAVYKHGGICQSEAADGRERVLSLGFDQRVDLFEGGADDAREVVEIRVDNDVIGLMLTRDLIDAAMLLKRVLD